MIEFQRHPVTGNVFSDWFEKYLKKGGYIEIRKTRSIERGDVIYIDNRWRLFDRWVVNHMETDPLPGDRSLPHHQHNHPIGEDDEIYCAGKFKDLQKKFLDIGQNVA